VVKGVASEGAEKDGYYLHALFRGSGECSTGFFLNGCLRLNVVTILNKMQS